MGHIHFVGNCTQNFNRSRFRVSVAALLLLLMLVPSAATAEKAHKPLAKAEVLELLENGVAPGRIGELARQYGVAFEITPSVEGDLRDAGADDELVKALHESAAKPAESAPASAAPTPAPPSPPVLIIETTPPGAEVYVDEERAGKTGPEGKLKISTLTAGQHRIRASLEGYEDYARTFDLSPGQSTVAAVALVAAKPPAAEHATQAPVNPSPAAGATSGAPTDPFKAMLSAMTGQSAEGSGNNNLKKFYVTHQHGGAGLRNLGYGGAGMCYGWLIIGEGRVQFSSNSEDHAFDVAAGEMTDVQVKSNHVRFRVKGKNYHLVTQDMGPFGGTSQGPGAIRRAFEAAGIKVKD